MPGFDAGSREKHTRAIKSEIYSRHLSFYYSASHGGHVYNRFLARSTAAPFRIRNDKIKYSFLVSRTRTRTYIIVRRAYVYTKLVQNGEKHYGDSDCRYNSELHIMHYNTPIEK